MNIEKARVYLKNEIYSMNCAINYRTVPDSTIAEFENLKDVYNTCLEAFRQLEQMTHYHDRLQDWDRGMTKLLESMREELAKYKAMVGE